MVDKRVSVVLMLVDSVVAVNLLLAHRVLLVPLQEQIYSPGCVARIAVSGKHRTAPRSDFVVIASRHIEIRAGKVALILVNRLENRTRVARECRLSEFSESVHTIARRQRCSVGTLAIREVAALSVHLTISRIHMERVRLHRLSLFEPAFRERVLAVYAVAHMAVVATLLLSLAEFRSGIHVPIVIRARANVRILVHVPQSVVAHVFVRSDDFTQLFQQFLLAFAFRLLVVPRRHLRIRQARE